MDSRQFDRIVSDMQALNDRSPDEYRKKVGRVTALGFGVYLGAFALVLLALAAAVYLFVAVGFGGFAVKVVLVLGALALIFARSMLVKIEPPEGRPLTKAEAPALHAEVERIREQIGAPEIHRLLLNDDFNAFATSSPKFAIFGERCYVVLGLPLLLTQRPDEISATIAHELAHHSRSHVKSGSRAYRLEAMWQMLLFQLDQSGSVLTSPMLAFVKWYSPRYSAMTLVLRRQAEYEADALGAEATSKDAMALGLLRMDIDQVCRLGPYSEEIKLSVRRSDTPPDDIFRGLMKYRPDDQRAKIEALRRALRRQTVPDDSHPCPRERTEALGIRADPEDESSLRALLARIGTVGESAAERFLGGRLQSVLEAFDATWCAEEAETWAVARKEFREAEKELAEFAGRSDDDLDQDESLKKLEASLEVHGLAESLPMARRLAERFPDSAPIQYFAGLCMLESEDEDGLAVLERVATLDPDMAAPSFEAVSAFRARRGESHEARKIAIKADELREQEAEEYEKLLDLQPSHTITSVGVGPEVLAEIARELPRMKRIVAAYAFRRTSEEKPTVFFDLVALVAKLPLVVSSEEDFVNAQAELAFEVLKGRQDVYVFVLTNKSPMTKRLRRDPQYQFYSANENP